MLALESLAQSTDMLIPQQVKRKAWGLTVDILGNGELEKLPMFEQFLDIEPLLHRDLHQIIQLEHLA